MTWGAKNRDWQELVADIQSEVDANKSKISTEHISSIEHYLEHGEYSMAFEYLFLEIMENADADFTLGVEKAQEIGLFFDLNNPNECMVDDDFWTKFQVFLCQKKSLI